MPGCFFVFRKFQMIRDNEEIVKRLFKLLCSFKMQPQELYEYLRKTMSGRFYPNREILYRSGEIVKNAFYVSDGYVACYSYDDDFNRQVVGLYGKDSIVAGKSFMSQQASVFEWVALPGAYLMKISHRSMEEVYDSFPESEELARLIIAGMSEKQLERLTMLKAGAEAVVQNFYDQHPDFRVPGTMFTDADLASYLLIAESTLRNVRVKLAKEGKLNWSKHTFLAARVPD
jgi:CRP-like cAMP-binding protein